MLKNMLLYYLHCKQGHARISKNICVNKLYITNYGDAHPDILKHAIHAGFWLQSLPFRLSLLIGVQAPSKT